MAMFYAPNHGETEPTDSN